MTDRDGFEIWDRTDEYQKIRNIEHSRIRKHFKDLNADENISYESCDWHRHWRHAGLLTGQYVDRSFSEYISGLCPDWIEKNPAAAAASHFKTESAIDHWLKLETHFRDQASFAVARKFKSSDLKTLIIAGACGFGKTALARAIESDYIRDGYNTFFVTCEKLIEIFLNAQPTVDEIDHEARQFILDMRNAELLIIDDLGTAEKEYSEFFKEKLKMLLDEHTGKMIITSNLPKQQIEAKFNDKIVSRIFEKSRLITLIGKDYRRAG